MLCTGTFGRIDMGPSNTLVVLCKDDFANMTCSSTKEDEIIWTYDGNAVINAPCTANTDVFLADKESLKMCNMAASVEEARRDTLIERISGPYGCTDQNNNGITNTSMVIVMGEFCHFCETTISTYLYNVHRVPKQKKILLAKLHQTIIKSTLIIFGTYTVFRKETQALLIVT